MDFHSLTRKELQFLCKLNKIPANITNVAMADALASSDIVEGIEKFINVTQSEKADSDESKENVEQLSSPKVPNTKSRTTIQKKVKATEPENLKPTATRTTRRTAKKLAGGIEESNNDALETPALSSTRRKAMATSSCRNVNSQLNDCEVVAKEDQKSPAAAVTKSRRKVATTSTTVKAYSTRRSTRQTEKKSGEPRVRKEGEKAVEINSMLDEMNVASDEVSTVEVPASIVNGGNPVAEVERICNAFEELDLVVEECVEKQHNSIDIEKTESDEISIPHEEGVLEEELNDVKSESDVISNPCENGDLEEEKHESEVMVFEEHLDNIVDDSSHTESGGDQDIENAIPCNTESLNGTPEEVLEDMVDETLEVTPTIDSLSPITEEIGDLIPEHFTDIAVTVSTESYGSEAYSMKEKNQLSPNPSTSVDVINHPTMTPVNKNLNKNDMLNTPALSSTRAKASPATSSRRNVNSQLNDFEQVADSTKKEISLEEVFGSRSSTKLTETKSLEVYPVEVLENTIDSGNLDAKVEDVCKSLEKVDEINREVKEDDVENLKVESDECENGDLEEKSDKSEEHSESFVYAEIESGSSAIVNPNDSLDDENNFSPNEENTNEDSEIVILENTEKSSESMNPDSEDIFTPAYYNDNTENDIKEASAIMVDDETDFVEETNQFCENQSSVVIDVVGGVKKVSGGIVSDDKENSGIVFKKEKDENGVIMSLQDKSLRQLKKQFKALTIKANNNNNKQEAGRPALQALCENQMVGGGESVI